jgi:hypothetical protein
MVVCDQVIRDQHTNKVSIIGSFNQIACRDFPAAHNNCAIYVALTEGQGDYNAELRFSFAATNAPVLVARGSFRLDEPLQVAELNFAIRVLPLPQPGEYTMEFFADGERLIGRRFVADQAGKEPTGGEN